MAKIKAFRGAFWATKDKKYAYQGKIDLDGKTYLGFLYVNEDADEDNRKPVLKLSALKPKKS